MQMAAVIFFLTAAWRPLVLLVILRIPPRTVYARGSFRIYDRTVKMSRKISNEVELITP
jgi:hypothetical protein